MEKIKLFRQRNFGEIIGTAFDLLHRNLKVISLSYLFFVMPIAILSLVLLDLSFTLSRLSFFLVAFPLYFITIFIESVVLHKVIVAYENSDDPTTLMPVNIWALLKEDKGRITVSFFGLLMAGFVLLMVMGIASLIFGAVVGAIFKSAVILGLWFFFLMLIPIYFNICFGHFIELRLREDYEVLSACIESMLITFRSWLSLRTLGIYLISILIVTSFCLLSMLPYTVIIYLFRQGLLMELTPENASTFSKIIYCLAIVSTGLVFSYVYQIVLLGSMVNYFSITEEKEHIGLRLDISGIGIHQTGLTLNEEY